MECIYSPAMEVTLAQSKCLRFVTLSGPVTKTSSSSDLSTNYVLHKEAYLVKAQFLMSISINYM